MWAINLIWQVILRSLDLRQDNRCLIDSVPIPALQFHLVPRSSADWKAFQTTYGKVTTKNQTFFGYRLHLLITMSGVILDFDLTPANSTDLEAGFELLSEHAGKEVLGLLLVFRII